jgi:predicted amidohydrolase YtcJ
MEQAIEYYTLGSAYAEFAERRKGSITEGKLADLVMVSRDLLTIPPREILETRALLTVVGGRVVHESRTP